MGDGRNRNKPCWCGSGKKFKHCHLGREQQEPIKHWEVDKELRQSFDRKICSAPSDWQGDCTGNIIKAHTVPRSSSLSKIARDGHVYAFVLNMENLTRNNGKIVPELLGVKKASTFSGFCSNHDNAIFEPIENHEFNGSPEHCFLLGYRAIARELYTKESSSQLDGLRKMADKGRDISTQRAIQMFNSVFDTGLAAGVKDIRKIKARYDQALTGCDFSNVRAYVLEIKTPPPVMCSAGWFPTLDFDANILQDLTDLTRTPHGMTCTSFWGGDSGAIVFQWFSEDDETCERFVRSLHAIDDINLTAAVFRLLFEYFENVFIEPEWWEALPEKTRSALINRMARSASPFDKLEKHPLKDDSMQMPQLEFSKRFGVGFNF